MILKCEGKVENIKIKLYKVRHFKLRTLKYLNKSKMVENL